MMSKLWGWVVALVGLLGAALLFVAGQRNRAREATSRAKAEARSKDAVLEAERAIDRARNTERVAAQQEQKRHDDHKAAGTRPDVFGDSRLRNDRDGGGSA